MRAQAGALETKPIYEAIRQLMLRLEMQVNNQLGPIHKRSTSMIEAYKENGIYQRSWETTSLEAEGNVE